MAGGKRSDIHIVKKMIPSSTANIFYFYGYFPPFFDWTEFKHSTWRFHKKFSLKSLKARELFI